jgi:ABC-type antimicrobial peptide transport system ATPase subunit
MEQPLIFRIIGVALGQEKQNFAADSAANTLKDITRIQIFSIETLDLHQARNTLLRH